MNVSRRRVLQGGALGVTATLLGWRPALTPIAEAHTALPALPAVGDLIVQQYGAVVQVTPGAWAEMYPEVHKTMQRRLYDCLEQWAAKVPHIRLVGEPTEWHARPGEDYHDLFAWNDIFGLKWSAEVRVTPAIRAYLEERQREMAAA